MRIMYYVLCIMYYVLCIMHYKEKRKVMELGFVLFPHVEHVPYHKHARRA